ncbi:hypothetical protein ABIE65_003662 [Constrictibacter sp. MBR-5]|uniref:hypothetical protein n=1 Tax=Constrictibacter sp. MBR-5 TaxID=3156467 RepID=UPI003398D044
MRIGLLILSFATSMAFALPARTASGDVFAPEGCEFSVLVAGRSVSEATEWAGRRTVSVAADTGRYAIRAACTTGYPAGALARLDRDARLAFVERLARSMGLSAMSIAAAQNGEWIDVRGSMPAAHVRARILYGAFSRLMVEVVSEDESAAEAGFSILLSTIRQK